MDAGSVVHAAGLVGALVSVTVGVADVLLLVSVDQGKRDAGGPPSLAVMATVPRWRLLSGGALGAAALPFMTVGVWHLYRGLAPAGPWLAIPPAVLLAYFFCLGAAAHFSFPFVGAVLRALEATPDGASETRAALEAVRREQLALFMTVGAIDVVVFAAGSLWFSIAVLLGHTLYPPWFGFLNPFALVVALLFSYRVLPSRVSRILTAACVHVVFAPLLLVSTVLLWNRV